MKAIKYLIVCCISLMAFACTDAQVAASNLSKAADMFEITRRVVFYNGITGEYMLSIEGNCSIRVDTQDNQLELTCKVDKGEFKKHYLGLSDNVTYFAEQIESSKASDSNYRVIFKPGAIVPEMEVR